MLTQRSKRPRGKKKAKVLDYTRQHDHVRRKSDLYQQAVFIQHGSEKALSVSLFSLIETCEQFNNQYSDNMSARHGLLSIFIKNYCTHTQSTTFTLDQIVSFYPTLQAMLGAIVNDRKQYRSLFLELIHLHFINTVGHSYSPTTRMKLFCTTFDRNCREKFS